MSIRDGYGDMEDTQTLADELCKGYLAHSLRRKGLEDAVPPSMLDACRSGRPLAILTLLRELADSFEDRNPEAFQEVIRKLNVTARTAYPAFVAVAQELFNDGIRWGRIMGLYALAAAVAVECVRRKLKDYVQLVHDWLLTFMTDNLLEWINEHKGWVSVFADGTTLIASSFMFEQDGFMQYYRGKQRRDEDNFWTFGRIGGMLALGGLVAAAFAFGK